ncbi:MAG TPA: hypothetical protein GXX37_15920 [Clostridiaceae bacterium]|nr:hypothetical protein [Clostridiaceae bacterium]
MRRNRSLKTLFVFVFTGAVVCGILGEILSQFKGMEWIALGGVNGYRELFSLNYNPLIDTNFLRFGLNLAIRVNLGSVVGIISGVLLYFVT